MTWGKGRHDPPEGIRIYAARLRSEPDPFIDPWPELDPRPAVDFLRARVAEQLAANPNAPTILDAVETARRITAQTDRQFWEIVGTGMSHG